MSPRISRLASEARPSPTMTAAAGTTAHEDPISLAVGEPPELPPEEVIEAAILALREGRTRYGPVGGLLELRACLGEQHAARTGVPTSLENALVTVGGKQALMDSLRCILDPGDEALILAPCWPTIPEQVRWCGATPVMVPAGPDLLPDIERVKESCNEKTRALVLNTPSNPSGRVFGRDLVESICAIVKEHDLWLISDEVYRDLALDGRAPSPLEIDASLADCTVVIDSFSKRFSMTGYRVGAAIGPSSLIAAMLRLSASSTTHPAMPSQYAALAALELDGTWEARRLADHRKRRDEAVGRLGGMPGISIAGCEAGLFVFPDVRDWIRAEGLDDDTALASLLREELGILVVPGSAFGAPGHLRISWCVDDERLETALQRLEARFTP